MNYLNIPVSHVQSFFLIFLRVVSILMIVPVFDSRSIPLMLKAGLAFSLSIVLFPVVQIDVGIFNENIFTFAIGVAGEILIGVAIGIAVKLIFAGFQIAGQINGIQMGLGLSNVMDPAMEGQISTIGQFNNLFALLVFLSISAHHWYLKALVESFTLVPPCNFKFSASLMHQLINLAGKMFVISIKVAAPVMCALLITSVAFGIMARTVPQMNIMFVAMPVKICIGWFFMGIALPFLFAFLKYLFNTLGSDIFLLLKTM